jgi:RNA polymerase sigma factor for flagellar operon FliA
LVAAHIGVARRIALRVARTSPAHTGREDLVAAALLGLTEAANRYEPARSEPFVAFAAKRIRGAVLDELRRADPMTRGARRRERTVARATAELEKDLGRAPEHTELAEKLGVSVRTFYDQYQLLGHVRRCSFDEHAENELGTDEKASPMARAQHRELIDRLRPALSCLSDRERSILRLHYHHRLTYESIGRRLGVSASRVCQLHTRALHELRAALELGDAERN